jgi:hypothetical protein
MVVSSPRIGSSLGISKKPNQNKDFSKLGTVYSLHASLQKKEEADSQNSLFLIGNPGLNHI